jgi:hypothetical protein
MTVYVIAGIPGVGKTSQIFSFAKLFKPVRWASFESKDKKFFDMVLKGEPKESFDQQVILKTYPVGHMDSVGNSVSMMPNATETLGAFEMWVNDTIRANPKTTVVDGISGINEYARDEWIFNDNAIRVKNNLKPRKSISGENKFAYSEINDRVKRLIMPLIQWGYDSGNDVFLTANMTDKYIDGNVSGEKIDAKPWIIREAEVVLTFMKDREHYWTECSKIPNWAHTKESTFAVDLRRDEGLIEVLSTHGFITR